MELVSLELQAAEEKVGRIFLKVNRKGWGWINRLISDYTKISKEEKSYLASHNSVHPNSVEVVRSDFHVRTEKWTELDKLKEFLYFDRTWQAKTK